MLLNFQPFETEIDLGYQEQRTTFLATQCYLKYDRVSPLGGQAIKPTAYIQ